MEGYPAAEMKHGPIALISQEMPVVVVAPRCGTYEKVVSNIQEIKARKGRVIAIVTEGDTLVSRIAELPFPKGTVSVGIKELFETVNLFKQLFSFVSIFDADTMVREIL